MREKRQRSSSEFMETYRFWTITWVYTRPIEQETNLLEVFPLAIAEGVHEFGQSRCPFDFEKNFVVVICNFYVEMLGLGLIVRISACVRRLITVRHGLDCGLVYDEVNS